MLQPLLHSPLASLLRPSMEPIGFTPYVLFAGGQQGAWYAPSEAIATPWYQDSAATTPITAVEQPIGNARDKSGNANHALQATAAARPGLSARVNLLTKTEQFDDAATWLSSGNPLTVTPNTHVAPNGTLTADTITFPGGGSQLLQTGVSTLSGAQVPVSVWARSVAGDHKFRLKLYDGVTDLHSVEFTATASWFRFSHVFSATGTTSAGNVSIENDIVGSAGSAVFWGIQLETGQAATRYQRVNTATDYDTAAFPSYDKSDGIDDGLSSATGGGGTAGFFFCQAIKPTSGAGTARTIWSDAGANTGYKVQIDAANKLSFSAGNGTAYTAIATAATADVGTGSVLMVWDDGTNLNAQIGNGAVASVARPTVSAGTAGFTLGKDNGAAASFFSGNGYACVYVKNSGLTAAQRDLTKNYVAQQAGVTL